jgi:hypothetical protein
LIYTFIEQFYILTYDVFANKIDSTSKKGGSIMTPRNIDGLIEKFYDSVQKHRLDEGKYCRCLRVWFDNLCYEGPIGSWNRVTSFWGHRDLMLIYHLPGGGLKVNNVLYLIDKQYDTLEEAVDSLLKPEELSFASFCDEIFADG